MPEKDSACGVSAVAGTMVQNTQNRFHVFTHLVVDRLGGWGWGQSLADPSPGVESHGLGGFALGPEVLRKHCLLIIEILEDKQRHTFTELCHNRGLCLHIQKTHK